MYFVVLGIQGWRTLEYLFTGWRYIVLSCNFPSLSSTPLHLQREISYVLLFCSSGSTGGPPPCPHGQESALDGALRVEETWWSALSSLQIYHDLRCAGYPSNSCGALFTHFAPGAPQASWVRHCRRAFHLSTLVNEELIPTNIPT